MKDEKPFLVLDGGLSSELERRGHDLNHPMWSARLLLENPDAIREVHASYLQAGADVLVTSSYQASFEGFRRMGLQDREIERLMKLSISLAKDAVDQHITSDDSREILIAASAGTYGAFLADGSEYRGKFGVSKTKLREFHERRFEVLVESQADLIAFETLPDAHEVEVLAELIQEAAFPCWFSFSCRDGKHINDGTPVADVAAIAADADCVFAVGVNCTPPEFVTELIKNIQSAVGNKRVIVYPNSGEKFDGKKKEWKDSRSIGGFGDRAVEWYAAGASIIGGCCRVGPDAIKEIADSLLKEL